MKRFFDIFCSFLGILILTPVFIIISILIRIDSRGPVLFIQKRIGRNFKPFNLWKFRSMIHDATSKGLSITVGGDPRITRLGKMLRRTKLDEIPQLVNVLIGDMSIVGPRPEVEKYVNLFEQDYREILEVKPGITDIASITYLNEETVLINKTNPEDYYINNLLPEKIKLAKEYIQKASFIYDIKIMLLTISNIFNLRGAHHHVYDK